MALEFAVAVKALDEYIEILKHELLFSTAERKLKPENKNNTHKIITIKRDLDKAVQERMKLSQIYYDNINKSITLTSASA